MQGEQGKAQRENTAGIINWSFGLQNPGEETQLRTKLYMVKTK